MQGKCPAKSIRKRHKTKLNKLIAASLFSATVLTAVNWIDHTALASPTPIGTTTSNNVSITSQNLISSDASLGLIASRTSKQSGTTQIYLDSQFEFQNSQNTASTSYKLSYQSASASTPKTMMTGTFSGTQYNFTTDEAHQMVLLLLYAEQHGGIITASVTAFDAQNRQMNQAIGKITPDLLLAINTKFVSIGADQESDTADDQVLSQATKSMAINNANVTYNQSAPDTNGQFANEPFSDSHFPATFDSADELAKLKQDGYTPQTAIVDNVDFAPLSANLIQFEIETNNIQSPGLTYYLKESPKYTATLKFKDTSSAAPRLTNTDLNRLTQSFSGLPSSKTTVQLPNLPTGYELDTSQPGDITINTDQSVSVTLTSDQQQFLVNIKKVATPTTTPVAPSTTVPPVTLGPQTPVTTSNETVVTPAPSIFLPLRSLLPAPSKLPLNLHATKYDVSHTAVPNKVTVSRFPVNTVNDNDSINRLEKIYDPFARPSMPVIAQLGHELDSKSQMETETSDSYTPMHRSLQRFPYTANKASTTIYSYRLSELNLATFENTLDSFQKRHLLGGGDGHQVSELAAYFISLSGKINFGLQEIYL